MNKTYQIFGLTDCLYTFRANKARIKVHFSGGSITAYGVTPATFTTSNAMVQHAIEKSVDFNDKKITIADP